MDMKEDAVNNARDILFAGMVSRCVEQCDSLNIVGAGQPLLKLKERSGENALMSRPEDVYDMYTYVTGIVDKLPKGPLSSQIKFPQGNLIRKESVSECNCRKCGALISELRAQVSELKS